MVVDTASVQARVQQLEKENRILTKKLGRAEATCIQLEETTRKKESLLRQVIHELKDSQTNLEEQKKLYASLEKQSHELQQALADLKRAQTQLIQSDTMSSLGQLVAGVAHEINNPVNFIHGNLHHVRSYAQALLSLGQLYQRYYPEPVPEIQAKVEEADLEFVEADLPKILTSMQMGTDRIRQIVLSLRNFSRMDEAAFKAVNVHDGLNSTLLILQHRLKETSKRPAIQVIQNYGNLPLVECYPGQLNQAFMNILANAIDALEEANARCTDEEIETKPGQITIQTSVLDSTWVNIAIADNGMGMTEAVQKRIFDPFFTTKSVGKGTGMGMSISYQIITEKHGGQLDCISAPGQGTELIVQIPIQQDAAETV